ncbi:MAG: J domain-containing protein [Gammaproteobacteria bacterium]|nr:J domain-containing protein [Gammaproteobacteria bacterium]
MLSQLFSTIKKAIGWLASAALKGITMIGNGFKSLVVNSMSIDIFIRIAEYLPIGGWLEHEKLDIGGENSVHAALMQENKEKLRVILRTASASEKAIHKYLLTENLINSSPLEEALGISRNNPGFLKIMLAAVKPEKRLGLLESARWLGKPFIFGLMRQGAKVISYVMNALPEHDRFKFMGPLDAHGNNPGMVLLRSAPSYSDVKAFFQHYPQEHIFTYLTKRNDRGQTALMNLLAVSSEIDVDDSFEYVFNLVPKKRRKEFLDFHGQGEKLMLNAYANDRKGVKALLRKNGIKIPKMTKKEAQKSCKDLIEEWKATEKFKEKFGAYPLIVLGLEEKNYTEGEIKRAYHVKMLKYHPDRNKKENASKKAQKIASAYEFYSKPDVRKNYLGR